MTVRIPLRLIALVLYTSALLGGAFGISVAVSDWRDDDAITNVTQTTTTSGISAAQARQIAREERDRAITLLACIISFRGSNLSVEQARIAVQGCREQAGW